MKRIILHWTAGSNYPNSTDFQHYHLIVHYMPHIQVVEIQALSGLQFAEWLAIRVNCLIQNIRLRRCKSRKCSRLRQNCAKNTAFLLLPIRF